MADTIYPKAKQAFAGAEIDWDNDVIVAIAVDLADYTYDAAHEALADIPVGARAGTSAALASKTRVNGVLDSADPVIPSVTGDPFEAIVLYDQTADKLISYHDGLSVTPNGNNITVNVHASGWLAL